MSLRHRTRMATRRHNPNGWDPVDHNETVQHRKRLRELEKQYRAGLISQRRARLAVQAFTDAAAAALELGRAFARQHSATIESLITNSNATRQYGRDAGLDEDDITWVIDHELKRARETNTAIDWEWMRDQIDNANIREALSN